MERMKAIGHMAVMFMIFHLVKSLSVEAGIIIYIESDIFLLGEIVYICVRIMSTVSAVYLYGKFVLRKTFGEMYLGNPLPSVKWCAAAVIMPTAMTVFYFLFTKGMFYQENLSWEDTAYAICYSLFSAGLGAAIWEEVIFRGMALSTLQKAWGARCAVFLSSALYIIPYLGNVDTEVSGDVFRLSLGIMIAGTALSLVVYESGSVWSSVVIHAVYNILSGSTLIFHMGTERDTSAIWNYTFDSDHVLLTGVQGLNEMDTGIPAMTGFLAIIFLAVYFIKKRGTGIRYAVVPGQEP